MATTETIDGLTEFSNEGVESEASTAIGGDEETRTAFQILYGDISEDQTLNPEQMAVWLEETDNNNYVTV